MRGETDKPRRGAPDFQLLLLTLLLVGFGIVMVFSSSSSITLIDAKFGNDPMYFTKRQIIFACLGLVFMFVTMNIRYDKYKKLFVPVFILAIMMLVLVPIIGDKRNGATSWFAIGTLGIQPTELAKITTILYLAALISKKANASGI